MSQQRKKDPIKREIELKKAKARNVLDQALNIFCVTMYIKI